MKRRESEVCQLKRELAAASAETTSHRDKLKEKQEEACSELADKSDRLQKLSQR